MTLYDIFLSVETHCEVCAEHFIRHHYPVDVEDFEADWEAGQARVRISSNRPISEIALLFTERSPKTIVSFDGYCAVAQ